MPLKNDQRILTAISHSAHPLTGETTDFDPLLKAVGDARFVLIGEASHGTHEFYRLRAQITKRLIAEKGFTAVAVEADWPDAYRVSQYVRFESRDKDAIDALAGFQRFPAWMWRNADVLDFVGWLRNYNEHRHSQRVGFYGLDLYSLHASIRAVLDFLDKVDPDAAHRARYRYSCFENFGEDTQAYGYAASFGLSKSCENEAIGQWMEMRRRAADLARRDGRVARDAFFFAEQNARLVKNAEKYYRAMFQERVSSWNLRDSHMAETLDALTDHLGSKAKIVVWAHNSHLGDARATEMGAQGRTKPRATRTPTLWERRRAGGIHDLSRNGDGGIRVGWSGGTQACSTSAAWQLRSALSRNRNPQFSAVAGRQARDHLSLAGTALGTSHRCHLSAAIRAREPLLSRPACRSIRCYFALRRDACSRTSGTHGNLGNRRGS